VLRSLDSRWGRDGLRIGDHFLNWGDGCGFLGFGRALLRPSFGAPVGSGGEGLVVGRPSLAGFGGLGMQ
jgi:hypothetical protein